MRKLFQKISVFAVATLVFTAAFVLSIDRDEQGNIRIVVPTVSAQSGGGESGYGENCVHIYYVIAEGMGVMPLQCCLTRRNHVIEYFECFMGDCGPFTGYCPGTVIKTTTSYEGINCCAK